MMEFSVHPTLIVLSILFHSSNGNSASLVIVVMSQPNTYHNQRAQLFKQHIAEQVAAGNQSLPEPTVLLLHNTWPHVIGAWTIFPILNQLARDYGESKMAVLFCDEETNIELDNLLNELRGFDFTKELFLGHALRDSEAVIIHHFAFFNNPTSFQYPDLAAGFLLSMPLVRRLVSRMEASLPAIDFTIDIQHELALYVWDNGLGISLTDAPFLCGFKENTNNCATKRLSRFPRCDQRLVSDNDIVFAVKTCSKYHLDRLTVLKKTWGKDATNIQYFSDALDPSIPTITFGIPNTERGHCRKFMAILEHIYNQLDTSGYSWIVVVDDDTLVSVPRLKKLLSCYDYDESVILGERYGYGVVKGVGYDYITLGGGMILSRVALRKLIDSKTCHCASDDAPDDMTLGLCLKHIGMTVTHSPLFHQARPVDYSDVYLANQEPVSFHKHWMIDPYQVYATWLDEKNNIRDEL